MTMDSFVAAMSGRYATQYGAPKDGSVALFSGWSESGEPWKCGSVEFGTLNFAQSMYGGETFSSCLVAKAAAGRDDAVVTTIGSRQFLHNTTHAAILDALRKKYGPETDAPSPSDIVWVGRDPAGQTAGSVKIEAMIETTGGGDQGPWALDVTIKPWAEPNTPAPAAPPPPTAPSL